MTTRKPKKESEVQDPATIPEQDDQETVSAIISFTTFVENDNIYLDLVSEDFSEKTLSDISRIIVTTMNLVVQAQAISTVKQKLIEAKKEDLIKPFVSSIISDSIKFKSIDVAITDGPCIKPSDLMKG